MQMCEDSGSDISGSEHLLLIGKHSTNDFAHGVGGPKAGWQEAAAGLQRPLGARNGTAPAPARRCLGCEHNGDREALGPLPARPSPGALGKSLSLFVI